MTSLPLSVRETAAALRNGTLRCEALVQACLERIEALQPQLNAFITILPAESIAFARRLDAELGAGRDRGPLHGIPIVHKDLFDTAGVRTTAGSRLLQARVPTRNAVIVQRLADAGAIMLGKTNLNELAAGTSGKNVFYGDVRNPWDTGRSAGGSSSGTAAAIAAGLCLVGTGSDTGGSIRIPAACNGLVGLRPGFGRLPLEGVTLRSRSLDTAGPLARTAGDCALLYAAMAGTPSHAHEDCRLANLAVGIPEGLDARLDARVGMAFHEALKCSGAKRKEVAVAGLFESATLEAMMDLMLYEFHDLLRAEFRTAAAPREVFGPVVLANLERGARIPRARYEECLHMKRSIGDAVRAALREVDILALPVLAAPTPALDAPAAYFDRQRELTLPLSGSGLPVLSLPCGRDGAGLPLGLQLVAGDGGEEFLLALAAAFEPLVGWPGWRPPCGA